MRGAGGRPNMLVRYPDGIEGEHFYQKRLPKGRPRWIDVVELRFPSGRVAEEVVPRDVAALAWLANLACRGSSTSSKASSITTSWASTTSSSDWACRCTTMRFLAPACF